MVCQDIGWGPLYFGIVGVYSGGFMNVENTGGYILVIIEDLGQVGVLGRVGVGGIGLELLPSAG